MPECKACPACTAPKANIAMDCKRNSGCQCTSCCCSKPPVIKPCYKQPPVPESFAPIRCYQRPANRIETCTTYKLSYLPVDGCTSKSLPVRPIPNIIASGASMEGDTIQRLSYLPNPVCVTNSIKPCHHDMWGRGPMQAITTQRHDYVPKPLYLRPSCKPMPAAHCLEGPFEDRTINRLSYIAPERIDIPKSCRPQRCYEKPAHPMDSCTIQKLSFQPVCAQAPFRPPWADKGRWQKPCGALEGTTIYKASYLPPGEDCTEITDPCAYGDCQPCLCQNVTDCITKDLCQCTYPKKNTCRIAP